MFGYPCPICNQRLLASPERVGQRTICPKCLKPIVIPRSNVPPPEPLDSADDIEAMLTRNLDGLRAARGQPRVAASAIAAYSRQARATEFIALVEAVARQART